MSAAQLGAQFAKHFFTLLDSKNYAKMNTLFTKESVISFEGNNCPGPAFVKLLAKWNQKYPKTEHKFEVDVLPTLDGGNLLFMTGRRRDKDHATVQNGVLFVCSAILRKAGSRYWVNNLVYRGEVNSMNLQKPELKIGSQFVGGFYKAYDQDVKRIANVYTDKTYLKWEKDELKGSRMIVVKLTKGMSHRLEEQHRRKLPFKSVSFSKVQHKVQSCDVQIGGGPKCLLVQATGLMCIDGDPKPLRFGEVFLIANVGSWKVLVQGFRMIY